MRLPSDDHLREILCQPQIISWRVAPRHQKQFIRLSTPPPQNQSTPPAEVPLKAITEAFLHQSHAWNFSVLLNKSVCVCVCVTVFRATDK